MTDIEISNRAQEILKDIEDDFGESVAIMLNDGCCDGMGPVVIEESMVGANDDLIGHIDDFNIFVPFEDKSTRSDKSIQIYIKEVEGVGSFSLEVPRGYRLMMEEQSQE